MMPKKSLKKHGENNSVATLEIEPEQRKPEDDAHSGAYISLVREIISELENKFYAEQLLVTERPRKTGLAMRFDQFIDDQEKVSQLLDESTERIYLFIQSAE